MDIAFILRQLCIKKVIKIEWNVFTRNPIFMELQKHLYESNKVLSYIVMNFIASFE